MDMKLEVVVIPVSDVDKARDFYQALGWRLDADVAPAPDYRVVQLTPPGSACSIAIDPRLNKVKGSSGRSANSSRRMRESRSSFLDRKSRSA